MYKSSRPIILLIIFLFLTTLSVFGNDARAEKKVNLSKGQTVYVPLYSHIYGGDRERPLDLAATLSIRNTDPDNTITITLVDYYDSKGKHLVHYLKAPVVLEKMSSIRFVVKESDRKGGSGANFRTNPGSLRSSSREVLMIRCRPSIEE